MNEDISIQIQNLKDEIEELKNEIEKLKEHKHYVGRIGNDDWDTSDPIYSE